MRTTLLGGLLLATLGWAPLAHATDLDIPIVTAPPDLAEQLAPVPTPEPETIDPNLHAGVPWLTKQPPRPCERTTTVGFSRGRYVPYQGVTMNTDQVVSENALSGGCGFQGGFVSVTFNASAVVASGNLGERGLADELSLFVDYRRDLTTPLGTFDVRLTTGYRAVAGPRTLENQSDDYTEVGIEIGYPIELDPFWLRPYCANTKENPLNYANSLNYRRCGGQLGWRFAGGELSLDVGTVRSENSTTAWVHKNPWDARMQVAFALPYELTFTAGVRYDRYGIQDARGLCLARDVRVYRCGSASSAPLPQVSPFLALTRRTLF